VTTELRNELVRLILLSPPEQTNLHVATKYGVSQEWVRRVRTGMIATDLHPELSRTEQTRRRTCNYCEHWIIRPFRIGENRRRGLCSIGIPEAIEIGARYGVGCGAFVSAKP
jgi:hypothetical protein